MKMENQYNLTEEMLLEIEKNDSDLESFDFEEFSEELEKQLELDMQELESLEKFEHDFYKTEGIMKVVANVVSEQFNNRIAAMAGQDFIEDNRGMTLDLRKEAHIQTENFDSGKVATHNVYVDYEKRKKENYDNRYKKDAEGNVITNKKGKPILNRENFDDKKMRGEGKDGIEKDHTVSINETANDGDELTYFDNNELKERINGENNITDMLASHNRSKGDKSVTEWLDGMTDEEKKEKGITPELEKKYRDDDKKAREHKKKTLDERKREEEELGKKSRVEEGFRIGKHALKATIFRLLKNLGEEVLRNLISWFKTAKKNLKTLMETIKISVINFVLDFKKNLKDASQTIFNTIMTALFGSIFRLVMDAWNFLKQGYNSVKKVINYLKAEENKGKSKEELMTGVVEILIVSTGAMGAVALGQVIEKSLMVIPVFSVEIPILGSIASIVGMFIGALIAGVLGALIIDRVKLYFTSKIRNKTHGDKMRVVNRILYNQEVDARVKEVVLLEMIHNTYGSISNRHKNAKEELSEKLNNIYSNLEDDEEIDSNLDELEKLLGVENN